MQTPVCKKAIDTNLAIAAISATKPLPPLAAVRIAKSRLGVLLYRCGYGAFALSLLLVFYPFFSAQPLWLFPLILGWLGLWWGYCQQLQKCVTGVLGFTNDKWWLELEERSLQLELAGDVLCWTWLVILPLRDSASGKLHQLVIFGDALTNSDWARLHRWLRACLVPRA